MDTTGNILAHLESRRTKRLPPPFTYRGLQVVGQRSKLQSGSSALSQDWNEGNDDGDDDGFFQPKNSGYSFQDADSLMSYTMLPQPPH